MNPKALFIACLAHTLNLVVAKASVIAVSYFGVLQRIFSTSTKRWEIMKKHVSIVPNKMGKSSQSC